ncbi:MAG: hypothetical protein ACLSWI_08270 [Candidatus Gastranaerophilaceae bacterium]
MKIQQILPQQLNKEIQQKENIRFTGASDIVSSGLRFLDTNQAWGANAVDLCSMVIPRTTVDFINRGPEAGTETARRESAGTINHSLVGVYGTGAGLALAALFNNKYGIRADKIFADNNTIDILAKYWHEARQTGTDNKAVVKAYTDKLAANIKFFNTDLDKESGLIAMSEDTQKEFSSKMSDMLINKNDKAKFKEFSKFMHNLMTSDTGAESRVVLEGFERKADNTSKTLIANIYNVSKTFLEGKVDDAFKNSKMVDTNEYINGLKKLNLQRSALGLGVAAGIGMSIQPLNMYLTKKKTGQDGFVGVPGREKDKTKEFKIMKSIAAVVFSAGALATITTNPKKFLSKIQFQGMSPTINQLKFVYGMTIASRLLAARDKDELRESAVKDSLGFLNLLILGSLVTKGTARLMDKSLINVTKKGAKNFFSWLGNSSLKTRDEVLYEALKKKGIQTVKDGKALPFKELIKSADDATKSKLRALNISQIVGYLYSGLVLGVGIPKLNIYMTNKSEAKRQAKLAAEGKNLIEEPIEQQKASAGNNISDMLHPENLAFLSKNM